MDKRNSFWWRSGETFFFLFTADVRDEQCCVWNINFWSFVVARLWNNESFERRNWNRKVKIIKLWSMKRSQRTKVKQRRKRDGKEVTHCHLRSLKQSKLLARLCFRRRSSKNTLYDNREFCFFCFGHFRLHQVYDDCFSIGFYKVAWTGRMSCGCAAGRPATKNNFNKWNL